LRERIVVAMSGGVDSSLAAALLTQQGYQVIGIMLRLWSETEPGVGSTNKCCSPESVTEARLVASELGIPFYLINVEHEFRKLVVEYFIQEYGRGRTPNPCIVCNQQIRFGYLLRYARMLGASRLATGHYARVKRPSSGGWQLWRGIDRGKDQSYMLHMLGQEELAQALFPVGEYTKAQVRQMAAERGLPTASRQESQDLCFVADGDYRRFLQRWAPSLVRPGPIVDTQGRQLGEHKGLPFYTVGQRRRLGISAPRPLYVLALRPQDNALIVGYAEQLRCDRFATGPVHWISGRRPSDPIHVQVQIRYRASPVPATVVPLPDGCSEVRLTRPLRDITPGQSAVFYDGDLCLGGGRIDRAIKDSKGT